MKPPRALAILAVPFAVVSMALAGGMCLTPLWECKVLEPLSSDWVAPMLFIFAVFIVIAVLVLGADLLVLAALPAGPSRKVLFTVVGAAIAVAPWVVFKAVGGQGLGALNPQLEYLPFIISGGLFAYLLERLVGAPVTAPHDA